MGVFDDPLKSLKRLGTAAVTGGASEAYRFANQGPSRYLGDAKATLGLGGGGGNSDSSNTSAINSERQRLLKEGMKAGKARGEELTGQTTAQTGADVQSIVQRRRENMNAPSRAASEIRSRGQQSARRMRAAGGSDAQQRQNEIETARMAGIQEDQDNERRTAQFQSLMGNILSTQSALEPAYGALAVGSQYIAPEKSDPGLFGRITYGLGL